MKFLLTIATSFFTLQLLAQAPTINPEPGYTTWCPNEERTYEVYTTGAQQTGCKYAWSITNGVITEGANSRIVKVKWNDVTQIGTLSVTLTSCTQAENTTVTEEYIIRSVNGVSHVNFQLDVMSHLLY